MLSRLFVIQSSRANLFMKSRQKNSLFHRVLVSTLLLGGTFQLAAPVLAAGTTAGTSISNTATATYDDADPTTPTFNTTSNTVTITVAEVGGLSVTGAATTDTNGGTVLPGDTINYDYLITNVGNDPTQVFIPGAATVTGPGAAGTIQVIEVNGVTLATPINVPAGGATTSALSVTVGSNPVGSIPANATIRVRVPITVNALAPSGGAISVVLGNTGANDNSAATQNQPDATDGSNSNEVRSVDNPNGTAGETAGVPANGERESSASQQVLVGAQAQAFAAVLKIRTGYTPNTAALTDDVITYGLSLRVDSTAPAGSTGLAPANLVGTTINLNGTPSPQVLVSDAIPAGTVLTGTPTAPASWTPIYTVTPTTTTANNAAWTTIAPSNLATVTRIGFISNGPVPAGTTVTGLSFQVVTSGVTTTTTVASIAQLFGQTAGGSTTLVYDESGDQSPSNFNDNGTPGSNIPTLGVANPSTDGIDTNNNNTGTGPAGEINTFVIATPGTILSGPNGQPAAVGPTNNNDDFTNRSAPIPAGTAPNSTINPDAVTFTNTINNPSTTDTLTNILIVPDTTGFTAGAGQALPPVGTTVSLALGNQTAVYTFDGTNFVFTSGSAIAVPSIAPGVSVNYTVTVDLPPSTALSTDTGIGFSVPVFAFQDTNNNARPDAADTTQNRTIARVYTGFLRLAKEARIVAADGTTVLQDFSTTPATANIQPGNFIDYRITYTNISTVAAGSGNLTLSANNTVITEDGTGTTPGQPLNNWGKDNDANGIIDTSNIVTTARDSAPGSANITYFSGATGTTSATDQTGTTQATDVTKYVNTVTVPIEPNVSRTFTFRRRIN